MEKKFLKFPEGFLWGASTASHQVEGNNHNDWTEWELKNAGRLARTSTRKYSWLKNWKDIKKEATDPKNYISATTCDHYNRYEQDFDLAKELEMNVYRFSFEWARIEPEQGKFNHDEIDHYKKVIKALQDRGIVPFVTLWHWTFPTWISEIGGWMNIKTIDYYCRYAQTVVELFPEVKYWITLNEPEIFAREAYLLGRWPPEKRSWLHFFAITNNMIAAHNKAYKVISSINPDAEIGVAQNMAYFEPNKGRFYNKILATVFDWLYNRYFIDRIVNNADYMGLNYYFYQNINLRRERKPKFPVSDMGWEMCGYGIYYLLKDLSRYGKPIFITENGLADAKDNLREAYIKDILSYIHKAIEEGVVVRGYMHWSLLDNFEWDKGFWPRFGLIEVDYKTQERKIRNSARAYSDIIKKNGFSM